MNIRVQGVPVGDVLAAVARRVGADVTRLGSLWFIGSLRPQDRAVLVGRCARVAPDKLDALLRVYLSDAGRLSVTEDGIVVVGDSVEIDQKIGDVLAQLDAAPADAWLIHVYAFDVSREFLQKVGWDGSATVTLQGVLGHVATGGVTTVASAMLQAMIVASHENNHVRALVSPLMVLAGGVPGKLSDGTTYLLPQSATNDQGTQTQSTLVPYRVGLDVTLTVRPAGTDRAALTVDYSSTSLLALSDQGVPTTTGFQFAASAPIDVGGTALVGEVERRTWTLSHTLGLQSLADAESSGRVVQLWASVTRVGRGTGGPVERTDGGSEAPRPSGSPDVPLKPVGPVDVPGRGPAPVDRSVEEVGRDVLAIRREWEAVYRADQDRLSAAEAAIAVAKAGGR